MRRQCAQPRERVCSPAAGSRGTLCQTAQASSVDRVQDEPHTDAQSASAPMQRACSRTVGQQDGAHQTKGSGCKPLR